MGFQRIHRVIAAAAARAGKQCRAAGQNGGDQALHVGAFLRAPGPVDARHRKPASCSAQRFTIHMNIQGWPDPDRVPQASCRQVWPACVTAICQRKPKTASRSRSPLSPPSAWTERLRYRCISPALRPVSG
ncbi:hypothetical protein G6F57_020969 [Rhizopus arrhizus]|nr:hypothetical protein G6F57_020969 [Rhizopus arrhizus]